MEAQGERMYSSYSFTTSALDGGEWLTSLSDRALHPGRDPLFPLLREAGWAPEPVWTERLEGKSLASAGDTANHTNPINTKYRITNCSYNWDITFRL
jgi:hypothetical protein